MNIRLAPNMVPVMLFPYEVAHARSYIRLEAEASKSFYNEIVRIVEINFGKDRMDNKITIRFQDLDQDSHSLYVTLWDGRLYIGADVHFFNTEFTPIKPIEK